MLWIAITFILIIWFDWKQQKMKKVKLKNRIIPLMISILFFIGAEILFGLKDKMNVAMLFNAFGEIVQDWISGKS